MKNSKFETVVKSIKSSSIDSDLISERELEEAKRLSSIAFDIDSAIAKLLGISKNRFETWIDDTKLSIKSMDDEDLKDLVVNIVPSDDNIKVIVLRNKSILRRSARLRYGANPQQIAKEVVSLINEVA